MKKYPIIALLLCAAIMPWMSSCNDDDDNQDVWTAYEQWRVANNKWLADLQGKKDAAGNSYYKAIVPEWDPAAFVLIHYYNDRSKTEGNLSPMYTSTVDTRDIVQYYDGTPLDSSYNNSLYGPAIFRTQLSAVIPGWAIALEDMRVGDTAEVIIPYEQAYGASTGSGVVPYSALRYQIGLVDIADYEKNQK